LKKVSPGNRAGSVIFAGDHEQRKVAETPLMQQHNAIKARYPDAILLFRVGDFYETFGQDAIIASQVLGITLTKRNNGVATSSGTGRLSASCAGYLPAQTGESRPPRSHLRSAGRSESGQRHCKARRNRNGDARHGYQ
jgi:hypothetical protein